MIYRYMFMGFCKSENISIKRNHDVTNLSLAVFDGKVFMYFESEKNNINPENVVNENITAYPDGKLWQRMTEIFHYSKPFDKEHWRRKINNKSSVFKVINLKPEMAASYVFYHYQYQEERPGEYNKYGAIFMLGTLLVMYLENPREEETKKYNGKLTTHNTPENWAEIMSEHFAPWDDYDGQWRDIKTIIEMGETYDL